MNGGLLDYLKSENMKVEVDMTQELKDGLTEVERRYYRTEALLVRMDEMNKKKQLENLLSSEEIFLEFMSQKFKTIKDPKSEIEGITDIELKRLEDMFDKYQPAREWTPAQEMRVRKFIEKTAKDIFEKEKDLPKPRFSSVQEVHEHLLGHEIQNSLVKE